MIKLSTFSPISNINVYTEMSEEGEWSSFNNEINIRKAGYWGALSTNLNCVNRIINLFPPDKKLKILELGCAGGQFVVDFIERGHTAIGIDGAPGYKKFRDYIPNWIKYPNNFFICDIGQKFLFEEDEEIVKFDVITSWETFEHIDKNSIDILFENLKNHSKVGTYFIGSISNDAGDLSHRSIFSLYIWMNMFKNIGFFNTEMNFGRDVVRDLPSSFYFYLQRKE